MISRSNRAGALRAISDRVPIEKLPQLQPALLLQTMIGLSQLLNEVTGQPEQIAHALITDSRQRLSALREAAPHLDLSLGKLLGRISTGRASHTHRSHEQSAVEAALEMYIGLLLRWLITRGSRSHETPLSATAGFMPTSHLYASHPFSTLLFPFRARSCVIG